MFLWASCLGALVSAAALWWATKIVNKPIVGRRLLWVNLFALWLNLATGFWNLLDTYWN
jgi:hypothetical protein